MEKNQVMRTFLDGLLASRAIAWEGDPGGNPWILSLFGAKSRQRTIELAGQVEVFVLPSAASESRVIVNPRNRGGYLIGLSPLIADLSTEIAFLIEIAYLAEGMSTSSSARRDLDRIVVSYLQCIDWGSESQRPAGPLSAFRTEAELIPDGAPVPTGGGPTEIWEAYTIFSLAHELAHIEAEHFADELPHAPMPAAAPLTLKMRREVEADCAAYMAHVNYRLFEDHYNDPRPPPKGFRAKKKQAKRERDITLWAGRQAIEASESFYTAMRIIAAYALTKGDIPRAERLKGVAERRTYAHRYIDEVMLNLFGLRHFNVSFLLDWAELYRQGHDHFSAHFCDEVLPTLD